VVAKTKIAGKRAESDNEEADFGRLYGQKKGGYEEAGNTSRTMLRVGGRGRKKALLPIGRDVR